MRRLLLLGLASIVAPPALADPARAGGPAPPSAPSSAPASEAEGSSYETVVTGKRARQLRFDSDRSITTVSRERLAETQSRSVPEVLDEVPGVHLQQTNRGAGAPIIRGLVGPQNLILVDGIPFTTSIHRTGPNQYLTLLDPAAVRRVEVVRGPSSVLYGNGAMGGVMQVLTESPRLSSLAGLGLEARGTFSSADLTRGFSVAASRSGPIAAWLGLHFDWFDELRSGGGVKQPLSSYQVGYWQGKLAWALRPGLTLGAAYLGAVLRDSGRTDALGKGDLRIYDDDDHLASLTLRWERSGLLRAASGQLYYHRLDELVDRYTCATRGGVVADLAGCTRLEFPQVESVRKLHDLVDVVGGDLGAELALLGDRLVLRGGLELSQELVGSSQQRTGTLESFRFLEAPGNFADGSRYLSLGTYLQGEARLLELGPRLGRLQLAAGGRFTRIAAHAPGVVEVGDIDYAFNGAVGSVGLQLLRASRHNLYLTLAQGFRPPNLQETTQTGDTGQKYAVPNPELGPERSLTVEVGGKVALRSLELQADYFFSQQTDAIVWQSTDWQGRTQIQGKPVIHMVNANRGSYHGVEGSASYRLWRLTVGADAAWMMGDVEMEDGSVVPAQRVPPAFGTASVRYDHPGRRFFVEAFLRWAAAQRRLNPEDRKDLRICETAPFSGRLEDPCDGSPGWATFNLRGAWHLHPSFSAYLLLSNLTDQRYRTHGSGIDAPGVDARLTLRAIF